MDSYKEINRELILANQELKVQQSSYQKQIIILKNQFMEELERRVVSEKMIRIMIIDNFKNALKLLDPESSLLEVLQDNEDDTVQRRCQQKQQPTQILQELRRSNSLHRRSSIAASPTRRLTYSMKIVTPENENDGDNEVQDMSVSEAENSKDNFACIAEDVIQEEEEEEEDEEEEEEDEEEEEQENKEENEALITPNTATTVQDTLQTLENISIIEEMSITEIEEDSLPANTITSQVHDKEQFLENSPPPQVLIKNKRRNACYLRRSPLQDVSNFEGVVVNKTLEKEDSTKLQEHNHNAINVVVRRDKRRSLFENDSIQSVRLMNSQRKGDQDEIEVEAISFRETSPESGVTSIALSELSCGQFAYAPSSTPNTSQWQETSKISELSQTRASRRCKPKCYTEPKLNAKLRNDETQTQHTRRNTKKKNKK